MSEAWRDQPRWPRHAPPDASGDGQGGRWADEGDLAGAALSGLAWLDPDDDELPGGAPDMGTMLDQLGAAGLKEPIPQTAELTRRLKRIWEFHDPVTGLDSELDDYSISPSGRIIAVGFVYDPDGNPVAEWKREVIAGREVRHRLFEMDASEQGAGFTTRWFEQVLDRYRSEGIERVTVHANSDVGGYAWTHWFDFAYRGQAERFLHDMEHATQSGEYDVSDETVAELRDLLRRAQAGEHITARQVAMVGYAQRDVDRLTRTPRSGPMWLGKRFLLNESWEGVLTL